MRRRHRLHIQRRPGLWMMVGGGLAFLLVVAVAWAALGSQASAPVAISSPTSDDPMIAQGPPLSAESSAPNESAMARTVFTRMRSLTPS